MKVEILVGDVRERLAELPDESVHCVITSPPYWGLRDYGVNGQLGLEKTIDEYVTHMVEVFREVRRVLRKDGTLWLNMGDAYASSPPGNKTIGVSAKSKLHGVTSKRYRETLQSGHATKRNTIVGGLKPKDLIGQPWRLAFALQADGWWLRSDIIWHKPNPMPESITDRPTKSHEYMFLLTKAAKYFYDADAVRETAEYGRRNWKGIHLKGGDIRKRHGGTTTGEDPSAGRNLRDVWTIPTHPFPGPHYATFPPKLVEPCIKAGTSEKGCCPVCGAPWRRVVEKTGYPSQEDKIAEMEAQGVPRYTGGLQSGPRHAAFKAENPDKFLGWQPACTHDEEPVPCTVLDPFGGSGTTALVALRLWRNAILIELNSGDVERARKRLEEDSPVFGHEITVL